MMARIVFIEIFLNMYHNTINQFTYCAKYVYMFDYKSVLSILRLDITFEVQHEFSKQNMLIWVYNCLN